jgi:hypothetical protein
LKKIAVITLTVMFVFGLAATAFAVHSEIPEDTQAAVAKGTTQITLDGSLRYRGEIRNNFDLNENNVPATDNSTYDTRIRLGVGAKLSDKVQAKIVLQSGTGSSDGHTWGSYTASTSGGTYRVGNTMHGSVNFNQAWLNYKTDTFGVKVGHMPLKLGNGIFFDHTKFGDDAIVIYADPADGLHVGALTAKFVDGGGNNDQDIDAYVLLGVYKADAFNASADLTQVNDEVNAGAGKQLTVYNVGLRGDTTVGPVKIKADLEIQSGAAEDGVAPGTDYDLSGMAVVLGGSMDLGVAKVGLEVGMGSGDDPTTANENEEFITSTNLAASYPCYIYGPRVRTAANAGTTNTGIANTTYIKLSGGTTYRT